MSVIFSGERPVSPIDRYENALDPFEILDPDENRLRTTRVIDKSSQGRGSV